jgi:uncharacterized protein (DUF111 family)
VPLWLKNKQEKEMKLLIDPRGGMAGDMFSAALVSAGADFKFLQEVMLAAAQKLGSAQINIKETPDGASQLSIKLDPARNHLGGSEAGEILSELFDRFDTREQYRDLGMKILEILVKAEVKAHKEFNIVLTGDHSHAHAHDHEHDHNHNHNHNHNHKHPHQEEAFLHEAQDIVIDIMGAVSGLQLLDIEPAAELLSPVSVGGGHVHFSHGTLPVPAPAAAIILEQYGIQWKKGPIDTELFTPTGAAILAALGSKVNPAVNIETLDVKATGLARGTKILDIPPLKIFQYKTVYL